MDLEAARGRIAKEENAAKAAEERAEALGAQLGEVRLEGERRAEELRAEAAELRQQLGEAIESKAERSKAEAKAASEAAGDSVRTLAALREQLLGSVREKLWGLDGRIREGGMKNGEGRKARDGKRGEIKCWTGGRRAREAGGWASQAGWRGKGFVRKRGSA